MEIFIVMRIKRTCDYVARLDRNVMLKDSMLNSDMWVEAIGNSTHWRQAPKTVTLYGGVLEKITLDGNTLVTTNSDGSVTTSVPYGTHTSSVSMSGQSFTRTVTSSTTEVYAMPEGALYWCENSKTIVTSSGSPTIKTNEIYLYASNNCRTGVIIEDLITHII